MATRNWLGRAGEVPQVDTFTVGGTVAAGSTLTVTINTKDVTVTAAGAVAADAATLLQAALAASTYPEFQEITWTVDSAVVTGTGPADGTPFTATASAGGSGSPTLTRAAVTSPTGPNWWTDADNWSGGAVPISTDTVLLAGGVPIKFGLSQAAVALARLEVTPGFGGNTVGLPDRNPTGYAEYRDTRLAVAASAVVIDSSSNQLRFDFGSSTAAAITVLGSGQAATGLFAVDLLAANASTAVTVVKGQVGVAAPANTTSTVASVKTSFRDRIDSDAVVELGSGLTVTTVEQTGGVMVLRCGCTTLTREGGTLTRYGSGTITTLDNRGGAMDDYGTGTVTALHQGGTWTRRGLAPLTVTDCSLYADGATNDRSGVVTWTNPVQYIKCGPPAAPGDTENQPPAVHWFNFGYARKIAPVDV